MTTSVAATMLVMDANNVAVSAGHYFLGDPCYPFPNTGPDEPRWIELLRSCGYFDSNPSASDEARYGPWTGTPGPVGTVTVNGVGYPVVAFSTYRGDGGFKGSDGFEYGVDAGMIGLVPVALIEALGRDYTDEWLATCGTILDADIGFVAETDGNGVMTFGTITINTRDDAQEETPECFRCGYPMPYGYCESISCQPDEDDDED